MENKRYSVYVHTNRINGKKYVGITSLNFSRRWGRGTGYKRNPHFYGAINKYGWDSFDHTVVKANMPEECAKTYEKILIALYDTTNPEKGYNLSAGGEGYCGMHHTAWNKGVPCSEEHKEKQKITQSNKHRKVLQIKDDVIIAEYCSQREAARTLGLKSNSHIGECLQNKQKTAYGYEWRYKE